MKLSIRHAKDASFETGGLRDYFAYRDLGIARATEGKAGAQVIRAVPGKTPPNARHTHALEFQMIYILKGWARFWYEGHGEVLLEAGDCVHQPPGILHSQSAQSDDLEILEITLPAEFKTEMA
ncbi:MAG: cupin domain-containing protein [Pseudomonadota bacterium]